MSNISDITVAILAGGLGSRLHSINPDKQKILLEVNGLPFLMYLLDRLNLMGFREVVLCIGYLGSQIQETFGKKYKNLHLLYSNEDKALGTGGALRHALPLLKSDVILVTNGDSYCEVNLNEFYNFHLEKKAEVSLVVTQIPDTSRFGRINLDSENRIISFEEKKIEKGKGWINAGIYLINRYSISGISNNKPISLEEEIFPRWIINKFYGFKTYGSFIDIGIPQSYKDSHKFFQKASSKRFILLDRDGTLIVHKPYLSHPDQVELIPGVIEALKKFRKMGLGIVIVTNQSGVGRGYFDLKTLEKIHQKLIDLLIKEGLYLDDIYFCPHTPEDNCLCRKPKVELINIAAEKHQFNPKLSFIVGDNKSDIELGRNIGAKTILVRSGYGREVEKELLPDYVVNGLLEIPDIIKEEMST